MAAPKPAALHHTCFLVRDLEGTAQRLLDALGIDLWNIWTIEPAHCMVRGQERPFSFHVALTTVGAALLSSLRPTAVEVSTRSILKGTERDSNTSAWCTLLWRSYGKPKPSFVGRAES